MLLDIGNDAFALHHPLEVPQCAVNGFVRCNFGDCHALCLPPWRYSRPNPSVVAYQKNICQGIISEKTSFCGRQPARMPVYC